VNEFSIINKYLSNLSKNNKGSFGLSDDVFFDYKKKMGISIDTYNEGVHFLNFNNPNLVIKKVLRASISDLICKGINPKYYFISFSGNNNHLSKKNICKICLALKQEQKKYNIILSGGDTTRSNKLSITISSIGYSKRHPVLRSGAKNNDDIYITNNIGDAFMGLNVLKKKIKLSKKSTDYFIKQFYLPNIPIKFSKKIHLFANSSIDISDGFFQDLKHILSNSNLSSEIFVNNIPVSVYLNLYLKRIKKNKINLISNGDDYQILFTANKNKRNLIKKISKSTSTKVSIVGVIRNKSIGKTIKLSNEKLALPKTLGYIHNFN
jgi:thiamine-monophosphate kinase|tara:strand:+ start:819 stop:1784 length:966 start_codon:yes stop_codon:yes gene_type:complete